jgi:hypothetical protein
MWALLPTFRGFFDPGNCPFCLIQKIDSEAIGPSVRSRQLVPTAWPRHPHEKRVSRVTCTNLAKGIVYRTANGGSGINLCNTAGIS